MTENTRTRKIKPPTPALTKEEALGILASAINHCRSAGLSLRMGNTTGRFAVLVEGVEMVDGQLREINPLPEVAEANSA